MWLSHFHHFHLLNLHSFVYFSCKGKQCKIAMILLCPVQGPWASSYALTICSNSTSCMNRFLILLIVIPSKSFSSFINVLCESWKMSKSCRLLPRSFYCYLNGWDLWETFNCTRETLNTSGHEISHIDSQWVEDVLVKGKGHNYWKWQDLIKWFQHILYTGKFSPPFYFRPQTWGRI